MLRLDRRDKRTIVSIIGAMLFSQGITDIIPVSIPPLVLVAAGVVLVVISNNL